MKKFGLIGFPLGHSFSKKYFTDKFINENLPGFSYHNFPIQTISEFPGLIRSETDLYGLNVTIPYKVSVLDFVDEVSEEVLQIGAANVIKINRLNNEIHIKAFNSDVYGFINSIKPFISAVRGNAVILGSGGASKAVNYGLRKLGFNTLTVSRKKQPDTILYHDLTDEILRQSQVIVNATSLGMYPASNTFPEISYRVLGPDQIMYDLVYNPEKTLFLKMGEEQGCTIISGLRMLHLQAEKSWEIWTNPDL